MPARASLVAHTRCAEPRWYARGSEEFFAGAHASFITGRARASGGVSIFIHSSGLGMEISGGARYEFTSPGARLLRDFAIPRFAASICCGVFFLCFGLLRGNLMLASRYSLCVLID